VAGTQHGCGLPSFFGAAGEHVRKQGECRGNILADFRCLAWCHHSAGAGLFDAHANHVGALFFAQSTVGGSHAFFLHFGAVDICV